MVRVVNGVIDEGGKVFCLSLSCTLPPTLIFPLKDKILLGGRFVLSVTHENHNNTIHQKGGKVFFSLSLPPDLIILGYCSILIVFYPKLCKFHETWRINEKYRVLEIQDCPRELG